MQLERYELKAEQSLKVFEFTSEGPRGRISKIVQFGETNLKGLFNLAFGDKDPTTGEIDDAVVSNNNDSDKVLATVVATVYSFTKKVSWGMGLCNRQHKSKDKALQDGID